MHCILSDNLSAANVLNLCKEPKSGVDKENPYLQKYLYALILWEAIYTSPRRLFSKTLFDKACEKEDDNELVQKVKASFYDLPYERNPEDIEVIAGDFYRDNWYSEGIDKNVRQDALFYLALGDIENMNVLLSEERAKAIENSKKLTQMWSRENVINYIDKETLDQYCEINDFFGNTIPMVQTPLLVDYICDNATCLEDAINIAFQLKEQKDIIAFRQKMSLLDDAMNSGNIMQVKRYKDEMSAIIDKFVKKEIPTKKIDLSFTFTPTLNGSAISAMFGIPIDFRPKRRIKMNFLLELTRYGMTQRYRRF